MTAPRLLLKKVGERLQRRAGQAVPIGEGSVSEQDFGAGSQGVERHLQNHLGRAVLGGVVGAALQRLHLPADTGHLGIQEDQRSGSQHHIRHEAPPIPTHRSFRRIRTGHLLSGPIQ